jgi:hypothetical protein
MLCHNVLPIATSLGLGVTLPIFARRDKVLIDH